MFSVSNILFLRLSLLVLAQPGRKTMFDMIITCDDNTTIEDDNDNNNNNNNDNNSNNSARGNLRMMRPTKTCFAHLFIAQFVCVLRSVFQKC